MNRIKIIIVLLVVFTHCKLVSQTPENKEYLSALGLRLNKSLTVASSEINYTVEGNSNIVKKAELISNVFGIGGEFIYKVSSKSYLNISLVYSTYTINENIKFENNQKLTASSFDFTVNGNYYFSGPKNFTPYAGGGGGFIFINSNENDLVRLQEGNNSTLYQSDYLSDLNLFFNAKIGIHIPITEKLFVFPEFDFIIITADNLGVIPKLVIGASYWLE